MNNLLKKLRETFLDHRNSSSSIVLCDSTASANDLAFMLGGKWDECNGITLTDLDPVALKEAAALIGAKWCRRGDSIAFFAKLTEKKLCDRYKAGERYFINANLRCSYLKQQCLKNVNLARAFLNEANLSYADLSDADLTAADLRDVNLTEADLSHANLSRSNLTGANLTRTCLTGAKLQKACLKGANLDGANLDGANLFLADLRGANLNNVSWSEANLTDAVLTVEQLDYLKAEKI